MVVEAPTSRAPFKPGVDVKPDQAKGVFNGLVSLAETMFAGSNLVTAGSVTAADIELIHLFYRQAAAVSPDVFNQSTITHLLLTAQYAKLIGQHLNEAGFEFNLTELEALGLLHDVGRTFSHRRRRNDLVGQIILHKAGLPDAFLKKLPPDEHYWKPVLVDEQPNFALTEQKIADITDPTVVVPERGVIELADILAKVVQDRIITWREVTEVALVGRLARPDKLTMWPSEFMRQGYIYPHISGGVAEYYRNLGMWFENKTGKTMEEVVGQMQDLLSGQNVNQLSLMG